MLRTIIFHLLLLLCSVAQAPANARKPSAIPPEVLATLTEHTDIPFASYGERKLQLDVYRPKQDERPLPAVICIHGGGWYKGDRSSMRNLAQGLAARGFVGVTISYRLSGEAKFPAQIHDCKASVRFLRANAKRFGIDPNAIGVTGLSAGGHLAALLTTSGGVPELEGNGGHSEQSSTVQDCMAMGAQSDLKSDRIAALSARPNDPFYRPFLGGAATEVPARMPLHHPDIIWTRTIHPWHS